ncbi:MAG: glycoside hydrolase family 2 [Defluviitaleaceae bacterium]|nr:glycoside hydrolase family 2 [Defluviitaleaceae bacterium]
MDITGNFQENIHAEDYESAYLAKRLENTHITDYGREGESLNGMWRYAVDQYDTCLRAKWFEENYADEAGRAYPLDFSFDNWALMPVPSCWNLQAEKLFLHEGSIVYTRRFTYENHGEDRVFIRFGAANYQAAVFINKQYMGMHLGGSTPFYVEATGVLEKENRILVVVNNTRRRTNVPCDNTDWFNYGGLYRDVEILRLPKSFIQDFKISLEPGSDLKRITASIRVNGADTGTAYISIPELKTKIEVPIADGKGGLTFEPSVRPVLWDVENPKLYDVEASFGKDLLKERIGFREIKADAGGVYLNGKKIFLKGVCAHEDSAANGKAQTEDEIRENYRLAKEMNANFMRLAHYPHSEMAARIADEVGILLWEEIAVYWAIAFDNPNTYRDAENQLTELVNRDINRASVIIWSIGNENADTDDRLDFMRKLAQKTRELDPTRLVSAACLINHDEMIIADRLIEYIDIIGINEYYGWYIPDFSQLLKVFENSKPAKPVIISEFGADARAGFRGTADEMFSEDKQADIFRRQIEVFRKVPYLCGISPWIFFDFRCPRRTHFMQDYTNIKGLLTMDKTHKKLAFDVLREYYGE